MRRFRLSLEVGATAFPPLLQTGLPIARIGFSNAYTRPESYLDRRGSEGR